MIEFRAGYVDADFGVVDDLSLCLLFVLSVDPNLLLRGLNGDHALFFILSPGADPVEEVVAMGKKDINLQLNENYPHVAMRQGQDVVAMAKLDLEPGRPLGACEVARRIRRDCHPTFRVILSADTSEAIPIASWSAQSS